MKKNKIYIFVATLISILLFTISAICNLSALKPEDLISTISEAMESKSIESESVEIESAEIESAEEETAPGAAEVSEEKMQEISDQSLAPTIEIEIYEGPIYDSSAEVCYYRIKATVTGNPTPEVSFSRDDSNGATGRYRVQISLKKNEEYTLTATAENSEGKATDSITLTWGCGSEQEAASENHPPQVGEIDFSSDVFYTLEEYTLAVKASDPDGDTLTFKWDAEGGFFSDINSNPTKWTAPSLANTYKISVYVIDGKGGEFIQNAYVTVETETVIKYVIISAISSESGYIERDIFVFPGSNIYVGDSPNNKFCRGFISFDISQLLGKSIQEVYINLKASQMLGDPSFFKGFYLNVINWGWRPIEMQDFYTQGEVVFGWEGLTGLTGNFHVPPPDLLDKLNKLLISFC
jgi:hypothetical protein